MNAQKNNKPENQVGQGTGRAAYRTPPDGMLSRNRPSDKVALSLRCGRGLGVHYPDVGIRVLGTTGCRTCELSLVLNSSTYIGCYFAASKKVYAFPSCREPYPTQLFACVRQQRVSWTK